MTPDEPETCWRKSFWAGVTVGFLLGLVAAPEVKAQEHYIGTATVSNHYNTDKQYNEEHWGLFYERYVVPKWGFQAGYYKNSYDRDTWYTAALWRPLQYGRVDLGAFVGLATGYDSGRVSPIGGLMLTVHFGRVGVGLVGGTAVVANQIKWRLE